MTKILSLALVVAMVFGSACCTSRSKPSSAAGPAISSLIKADAGTKPGGGGAPLPGPVTKPTRSQEDEMSPLMMLLMGAQPQVEVTCPKNDKNCVPSFRLNKVITPVSVNTTISFLKAAEKAGAKAVVIEIDTPGGSYDDGFRLIKALEDLKIPSYCVADHEADSEGFAILQACTHRLMTKRTQLLTHEVRVGEIEGGTASQLRNYVANLDSVSRAFAEHCAARLKITFAEYLAKTEGGKDWFMNWEEALKVGAVDQVVPSVKWVEESLRQSLSLPKF